MNRQKPLPRTTQNIPSEALLAFLDSTEAAALELHSLMVVQHGIVLAEGWWKPYRRAVPHMLYSLSKSFTATAAAFAIAEGRFGLDDTVISFFPDDLPVEISDNLRAMRVRHLLSMATGQTEEPVLWATPLDSNWVRQFLSTPVVKEPGTHFLYNSPATYMVSALVEQTTNEPLLDYLTPRLLVPLGIEGATWETDKRGIAVGGWGLNLTTEDIACFGQLYLQKGVWQGQRLLSEEWVTQATSKQVSNGDNPDSDWNQGYGFQFWCCRHGAYRGDGAFGQFCLVMPEQDAVIAITSGVGNMGAVLNLVWEHLLPALDKTNVIPANPAADQRLTERLAGLAIAAPQSYAASPPPLAARISGSVYHFAENEAQIAAVTLEFAGGGCLLTFRDSDGGVHKVEGGLSDGKGGTTTFLQSRLYPRQLPNTPIKTSMQGAWIDETTLIFKLCFYETPFSPTLTFHFKDEQTVTLDLRGSLGFGPSERPLLEGKKRGVGNVSSPPHAT